MYRWSDEQLMIRDVVRQFVDAEIAPNREELEHGDLPPYDILRKLFATFGLDEMARERFKHQIEREKSGEGRVEADDGALRRARRDRRRHGDHPDHRALPVVPRHGDRDGRVDGAHLGRHHEPRARPPRRSAGRSTSSRWRRSARGRSPSRAPAPTRSASMRSTARRDGDDYVLNGSRRSSRTGPTPTRSSSSASSTRGTRPTSARSLSFVLDRGMPGLEQSKPLRKMGMHSSPTGELFLTDVRVRARPPHR